MSLPSRLVQQRPDILSAQAQLHAASAVVGVAEAQEYPSLTLSAALTREALTAGNPIHQFGTVWDVGTGLTAPIFAGGALRAQARGARDALLAQQATYRGVVLEGWGQVAHGWQDGVVPGHTLEVGYVGLSGFCRSSRGHGTSFHMSEMLVVYFAWQSNSNNRPTNPKGISMNVRSSIASTVSLLVGCGAAAFAHIGTAAADDSFLLPGALIISSSNYDGSTGAVAALHVGTPLANTNTATIAAVSDNNYVTVWNNDKVDGSFGVTSPIYLTAIEPQSGRVLNRRLVPTRQVVTSFSSKSELALHLRRDGRGDHLVFVGYASPGVGALDVSNSDAVPGQDPTNPVSFAFGRDYAFSRTIVSMDEDGRFSFTPTINYGGNNGRAALLGSNGLYYTVGNANNGNAASFGSASNGTTPDVTETTGLEVVNPINAGSAAVTIADGNSAEVDPLLQFGLGKGGADDKPGKDDNFRGITEYHGALYFTKGSGSNGVQTVYTVVNAPQSSAGFVPAPDTGPATGNVLPTLATAGQQAIAILNGFPTDSARASLADGTSGGDYTPFALFFANDHTLYVTDEGTGNSADAAHAGLEKWILGSNGSWTLAYTLTGGLIGKVDSNLVGREGQYPNVTTIGLRNLSGAVNKDGTVTLWAATSTSSTSGDNGADPNRVVEITDEVSATTLAGKVAAEAFRTIAGPTYGTVYRGVAYVADHDHDRDHDRDHGQGR
jgi:hypothetical protein